MTDDKWCPENDGAYRAEMAELHRDDADQQLIRAKVEIARLTTLLENEKSKYASALGIAKQNGSMLDEARAERDTARAETAMAFDVAATHYENGFPAWDVFGQFIRECRALPPANAAAALAARDKATREKALREAVTQIDREIASDPGDWGSEFIAGLERAKSVLK